MSSKLFREAEVKGKSVIWSSGGVMGEVAGLGFNLEGSAFLLVRDDKGSESEVPVKRVLGVGQYVVVRDEASAPAGSAEAAGSQTSCKFCGQALPPNALWCPSCNRALA